jgi:hypothetical protein
MFMTTVTRNPTVWVLLTFLALAGCATGTVRVDQAAKRVPVSTVRLTAGEHTIPVDAKFSATFETKLREALFHAKEPAFNFRDGDELTATYRFVQLNEGSRAKRYFIGFGAGKGTLTIEIRFRLKDGTDVGKIDVGGELSVGVFGGEFDTAIAKAAEQAAAYIRANFH